MSLKDEIKQLEATIRSGSIGYDAYPERKLWMKAIKTVGREGSRCPYCGSSHDDSSFDEYYKEVLEFVIKEFL